MASEDLFDFSEEIIPSTMDQINQQDIDIETECTEIEQPNSIDANLNESNQEEHDFTEESAKSVKPKQPEPKQIQLPLSKVRSIMKLDPDLSIASAEAVFAVTKATEMFINSLAKESYLFTNQAKKKTIQKRDVTLAIASIDSLIFLEGAMDF